MHEVRDGLQPAPAHVFEDLIGVLPVVSALVGFDPVPAHRVAETADAAGTQEREVLAPRAGMAARLRHVDVVARLERALEASDEVDPRGRRAGARRDGRARRGGLAWMTAVCGEGAHGRAHTPACDFPRARTACTRRGLDSPRPVYVAAPTDRSCRMA